MGRCHEWDVFVSRGPASIFLGDLGPVAWRSRWCPRVPAGFARVGCAATRSSTDRALGSLPGGSRGSTCRVGDEAGQRGGEAPCSGTRGASSGGR